jgi:hypothetical protein
MGQKMSVDLAIPEDLRRPRHIIRLLSPVSIVLCYCRPIILEKRQVGYFFPAISGFYLYLI